MTIDVPKSAASRNIDIVWISAVVSMICMCFDWTTVAVCCLGITIWTAINALKCFLDIQELNMHILNAILKRLPRKDNDDNKRED